jgi:hypothetical protein
MISEIVRSMGLQWLAFLASLLVLGNVNPHGYLSAPWSANLNSSHSNFGTFLLIFWSTYRYLVYRQREDSHAC